MQKQIKIHVPDLGQTFEMDSSLSLPEISFIIRFQNPELRNRVFQKKIVQVDFQTELEYDFIKTFPAPKPNIDKIVIYAGQRYIVPDHVDIDGYIKACFPSKMYIADEKILKRDRTIEHVYILAKSIPQPL